MSFALGGGQQQSAKNIAHVPTKGSRTNAEQHGTRPRTYRGAGGVLDSAEVAVEARHGVAGRDEHCTEGGARQGFGHLQVYGIGSSVRVRVKFTGQS